MSYERTGPKLLIAHEGRLKAGASGNFFSTTVVTSEYQL